MTRNQEYLITGILCLIAAITTGCSFLKLQPDPVPDDNIRITWEDTGSEHLVISYKSARRPGQEPAAGKEKVTPITLSVDTVSTDHTALFKEINAWMGTPYRYGKHDKKSGTDCSGFTMEIYKTVYGIQLNRSSEAQVVNTVPVKRGELEVGDLVFFNIRGQRISHVGLYIGNNKIVHATTKSGVIISDLDEKYYIDTYSRSGRVIRNP